MNMDIHLKNFLLSHKDNYDNVRNTLKQLFQNIDIISTNSLDRLEKQYLNRDDYMSLINSDETNFKNTIEKIITQIKTIPLTQTIESFNRLCQDMAKQLNTNNKINAAKLDKYALLTELDKYTLLTELEFSNFQQSVNQLLYQKFKVNHTMYAYDTFIKLLKIF